MQSAQSDLVNTLSSLEAHWHVLEAEVVEIGSDIEHCKLCSKKCMRARLLLLPPRIQQRDSEQVRRLVRLAASVSAGTPADEDGEDVSRSHTQISRDTKCQQPLLASPVRKEILVAMESFNNNLQGGQHTGGPQYRRSAHPPDPLAARRRQETRANARTDRARRCAARAGQACDTAPRLPRARTEAVTHQP